MTGAAQPPLRVALLTSAIGGGGGIAARRMAEALASDPRFAVDLLTPETLGELLPADVAPRASVSNRRRTNTQFSVEYPGYRRDWLVTLLAGYDLVNIQWAVKLISLAEIDALAATGTPVICTAHDYHYFTGGCHYPAGCTGMRAGCTACTQAHPQLCDMRFLPIILRAKRTIFARPNVHFAAPSQFLCEEAVASGAVPATRSHVLRNPFVPPPPANMPEVGETRRILLVADRFEETRKAMPLAMAALADLATRDDLPPLAVDLVGTADPALAEAVAALPLAVCQHGRIADEAQLAARYAGADLLLTCSYEDNWPNVLVEAGAQGTPAVVGPGHGCAEYIRQFEAGLVAADYSAAAFAEAMARLVTAPRDPAARAQLAQSVRAEHAPAAVADAVWAVLGQIGLDAARPARAAE